MDITSFPAGPWQANCYLLAPAGGGDVVVVDPGVGAAASVRRLVEERGVGVAGVLLTHGHLDHIGTAADVADGYGVPCWIHADDRELLTDPGPIVPASVDLAEAFGVSLREPADLRLLAGGETLTVGGLGFEVVHAPGHRPGCVLFRLVDDGTAETPDAVVLTGDVLFAGSIGRSDLPGGDDAVMRRTLRDVVLALGDDVEVLPGHGPGTAMAYERATNPYLRPSYLRR